ncbi:EcsC family protein [Pontibacillus yanchengensis]|uniref:EcsC family protein n=2 Tax=Pontibacillus yanchengensis TaxID=462910 RepID=A0ACC7VEI7_9BACI|nr:EcsC family protein [Pontibacillus yanchengensis]MYL34114.1 EcsC family protein [Pontibacillus yanchengensis]MYL53207.1 EcsC family protein [Pontibacillus yanchengensis]
MSEEKVYQDILKWENQWKDYRANDFEMIYEQWMNKTFTNLNPKMKKKFFHQMDQWFFHTHAYIQGTAFQNEARLRILTSGRIFRSDIDYLEDMKELTIDQLTYLAHQHIAKGKLYSFAQGGLTGTGGYLLLGVDFPLMMILNLRAVQLIGLTFGYEVNHPYEMMLSLKIFHAATLPKRLQKGAWDDLKKELEHHTSPFIYEGEDEFTDETWLEQPFKQGMKSLFILTFRKKLIQGMPIVSMVIGATLNYQLTRQVTDFALRFYQYRYLVEQGEIE